MSSSWSSENISLAVIFVCRYYSKGTSGATPYFLPLLMISSASDQTKHIFWHDERHAKAFLQKD